MAHKSQSIKEFGKRFVHLKNKNVGLLKLAISSYFAVFYCIINFYYKNIKILIICKGVLDQVF